MKLLHICRFTINIKSKFILAVCDIRLDFEQFTTNAPAVTTEITGGLCQDILTISTNTGQSIPEICGMNSGQHGKDNNNFRSKLYSFFIYSHKLCFIQFIWIWDKEHLILQL